MKRRLPRSGRTHIYSIFWDIRVTGMNRTYSNQMTREGFMGLEFSKEDSRINPKHDCTLPFTRMLAGPMDYTPGGFSNVTKDSFKIRFIEPITQGTRCHQLALYVVFESPLQCLSDYPENYRNRTGIEFLRHVPTTWNNTRVLNGEVGEYVTIASRNRNEWYLGCITDWTPREVSVSLDFLGNCDYVAEIFIDGTDAGTDAQSVNFDSFLVTSRH